MKKVIFISLLLLVTMIVGCVEIKEQSKNGLDSKIIAENYLNEKKYTIVEYQGNSSYILTKDKLTETLYMQQWIMQENFPDELINKIVYVENFIVKNHPLDNWTSKNINGEISAKSLGKVYVSVFIVDGKVAGGVSNPVTDVMVYGGFYNLEGKNFEDIHEEDFTTFRELWLIKYK